MNAKNNLANKLCSECSAPLTCGSADAGKQCWCAAYPAAIAADPKKDCLCEKCLGNLIQSKIAELIEGLSHEDVLAVASRYRGDNNLIEDIDYTIEQGRYVFTKWYHLKRGSCCRNGCRNCPY